MASPSPSALVPQIPSLANTYGAMMLGTFGGLMLYGLTVHQGYRYVHLPSYKKDPTYIKVMVAFVLILETIHSVLSMHTCYYFLAENYFRPEVLFHGTWSINLLPISTSIVIAISQSFFARRIYELNRCYAPIAGFVFFILLGELGFSIALTVEAFVQPDLLHFQKFSWMFMTALGLVIAADGILTVILTVVLHRSRTGFKSTDSLINVLIMYTINTGLLTGTVTLITFILGVAFPHNLVDDALSLIGAKLYATSMLAVLNSRHFLANYAKGDYESTPSRTNAVFASAVSENAGPYTGAECRACKCRPNTTSGLRFSAQPHEVVLDIRAAHDPDVSYGDVSVFTDQKSEVSLEHRQPQISAGEENNIQGIASAVGVRESSGYREAIPVHTPSSQHPF